MIYVVHYCTFDSLLSLLMLLQLLLFHYHCLTTCLSITYEALVSLVVSSLCYCCWLLWLWRWRLLV